jgi:hypothetical protein
VKALLKKLPFQGAERALWLALFVLWVPLLTYVRFHFLSNGLFEVQNWRQQQTALTILWLFKQKISFLAYYSPLHGKLWNDVFEFPLYQGLAVAGMRTGLSLETASRLVSLGFFFFGAWGLHDLTRRLLSRRHAYWVTLLYFASPLMVVYSRVCLIDPMASALLIAELSFAVRYFQATDKRASVLYLALSFLCGLLSGLQKSTAWFAPNFLMGLYFAHLLYNRRVTRKWSWMVALIVVQTMATFGWMQWAHHVNFDSEVDAERLWILGLPSDRLRLDYWAVIAVGVVREMLADWMLIPLLAALVLWPRDKRRWLGVAGLFAVMPVLIFMHVTVVHRHYLLSSSPFILLIAGVGLAELLRGPRARWVPTAVFVICAVTFKLTRFDSQFGPIFHDYRAEQAEALAVKRLTADDDKIYADIPNGNNQVALYSQRMLGEEWTMRRLDLREPADETSYRPTVFYSVRPARLTLMSYARTAWVDGEGDRYVVRVEPRGNFTLNVNRNIAVTDTRDRSPASARPDAAGAVTTCGAPLGYEIVSLPSGTKYLEVRPDGGPTIFLPARRYLLLPAQSAWGCHYHITFVSGL